MAERTTPDPEAALLRRRVIIELTQQELPLLAAAEHRHGTKRAAIVAALQAAAEAAELTPRLAEVERERDEALEAARQLAKSRAGEGKAQTQLLRERDQARAALAEAEREREEALAAVARLERRLAQAEDGAEADCQAFTQENDALRARLPDALYCARCERWVPEREWVWQKDNTGAYAYHRPCGDHGPALLSTASWLARRQP